MINLSVYFGFVKDRIFGGSLTRGQVEGQERIIDYWQSEYPQVSRDQMAYVLATIFHETARKMVPVKEAGGEAYLRSKRYHPYIGVGLVQVTWKQNWQRWGIKTMADGLSWPIALRSTFEGMKIGAFTGRKLSDYIGNGRRDYVGARRIINGTDRAQLVAGYAEKFREALIKSQSDAPVLAAVSLEPSSDFKDLLLAALRDDAEVREAVLSILSPHDEPGNDEPLDDAPFDPQEAELAFSDEPDETYG